MKRSMRSPLATTSSTAAAQQSVALSQRQPDSPDHAVFGDASESVQCACGGNIIFGSQPYCQTCFDQSERLPLAPASMVLAFRPARTLTPPPTANIAPRYWAPAPAPRPRATFTPQDFSSTLSSPDGGEAFRPSSRSSPYRRSPASPLDHADLASPLHEARPRLSLDASVASTPSSPFAPALSRDSSTRSSSMSSQPDRRAVAAEYAPMAAGFARLSRKGHHSSDIALQARGRPIGDLGARMFAGAD